MSDLPIISQGALVVPEWFNEVAKMVNAAEAQSNTFMGPTALTLYGSWVNWGGGYANAQVSRFGPFVVMAGLVRYNGASAININTSPQVATVPSGYRPHAMADPVGGIILTEQRSNFVANARVRVDITTAGVVKVETLNGSTGGTIGPAASNHWVSLCAFWIGE